MDKKVSIKDDGHNNHRNNSNDNGDVVCDDDYDVYVYGGGDYDVCDGGVYDGDVYGGDVCDD